jgi:capsular exopolysaccharide synthesis family protein
MIARIGNKMRGRSHSRRALPGLRRVIWRNRWIFTAIVVSALLDAAPFALLLQSMYTGESQIFVQPPGSGPLSSWGISGGISGAGSGAAVMQVDLATYAAGERTVIDSATVFSVVAREADIRNLKTFAGVDDIAGLLQEKLRVEVNKTDNIVQISMETPYPQESAKIVNAVVDAYVSFRSTARDAELAASTARLSKDRSDCSAKIDADHDAMTALRKKANVISFDDPNPPVVADLRKFSDALAAANRDLGAAQLDFKVASDGYPQDALHTRLLAEARKNPSALIMTDADLAKVRESVFALQNQLAALARKELPQNTEYRGVADQLERARAMLVAGSERQVDRVKTRVAAAQKLIDRQDLLVGQFYADAAAYANLAADVKRQTARMKTLDDSIRNPILSAGSGPVITVLAAAETPASPSSPHRWLIMLCGLCAGLAAATAVAYFREIRNPRLHDATDVQINLGLDVLGVVPHIASDPAHAQFSQPAENVTDVCRKLAKSLRYAGGNERVRTISIASANRGDGRSTLARNLALVLAHSGRRVLLIDADLRHPSLHRKFSQENRRGLANVLLGNRTLKNAILKTPVDHLYLLPAGIAKTDSAQLLVYHDLSPVLKEAGRCFDRVIVDCSAAAGGQDAKLVACACDATVLLIRAEKTELRAAENLLEDFRSADARVMGVAINHRPMEFEFALRAAAARLGIDRLQSRAMDEEDEISPAGASGRDV